MKKLVSAAIALSMSVSAFAPCVFAESDMEKIVSDVKSRAGVTDEYDDFSSNTNSTEDGFTEYSFNWSVKDGDENISVTYNSDDIITYYYEYRESSYSDSASLPKVTADEAKKSAQSFIDKLNPSVKGEYVVKDIKYNSALNGDYSFSIERQKNGVKVNGSYGNVRVSRDDGEPLSMYLPYQRISAFEDVSSVITADAAKSAFKENLGLELGYYYYYDKNKVNVFPAYVEKESDKYISAVTGEVYKPEENAAVYRYAAENSKAVTEDAAAGDGGGGGLSSVEISELDKIAGLISKADIEKRVRANETLNIPDDLKLNSISLRPDRYDDTKYTYSMYFDGEDKSVSVSADAKTGEISSFSYYNYDYRSSDDSSEEALTEEEVKAAAENVFNSLAGEKKSEYRFEEVFGNTALYRRYANDVKVMSDTIRIAFNGEGQLTSYSASYRANAVFPTLDSAMSADEAADKLFEAVPYEVTYVCSAEDENKTVAKAVYMLGDGGSRVNPFTGALIDYKGEEIADKAYEYGDIENHWAKSQIETLAGYGMGFAGGEFKPDEKITQRDFVYLLLSASPYIWFEDDDEMYKSALRSGLVSERNDTAEVTRGEMAKMMISYIGAAEYAKYDEIFVSPFKDVTEDKGYSAILCAMGVVKGDENGNFNPDRSMTRAEAACVIYNYLNR